MSENERLLTKTEQQKVIEEVCSSFGKGVSMHNIGILTGMALLLAQDTKTYPLAFEAGRKAGIKELVKFAGEQCSHVDKGVIFPKHFCSRCWQAKLSEVGVSNG